MVLGLGHEKPCSSQNRFKSGYAFSFPRLGCSSLKRFNSTCTSHGHSLFRLRVGIRFWGLSASGFFPPSSNIFFQRKSVLLFTGKASKVASSPYFSQNRRIFILLSASSVIIYRYRRASLYTVKNPLIPVYLQCIFMRLWPHRVQYVSGLMQVFKEKTGKWFGI